MKSEGKTGLQKKARPLPGIAQAKHPLGIIHASAKKVQNRNLEFR